MLQIEKIPVPTPYPVGPVNAYLVKNRPYTLIDPGPHTAAAKESLTRGLAAAGAETGDIARIVLTHSHVDHSGLARWLSEVSGAQIFVHRLEMRKLTLAYDFYQERLAFFQEAGMPSAVLKEILSDPDPVEKPVLPDTGVTALSGGEVFHFEDGSLATLHLPGHSDGHICLFDREQGSLLAGDFIFKHITPNPNMEPDPGNFRRRLPTLKQYLDGLSRLEELDARLVLPGHGENVGNCRDVARRAREHHRERLQTIASLLQEDYLSVYQIMRILYPRIRGFEIYLGISEVFAHVDHLYAAGKIVKQDKGGVALFQNQAGGGGRDTGKRGAD